mmetsp:Transcript_156057/g.500484  ORF Transcript_156057/g.500484 Transcript_156057/m.500484 type:complete len:112 (+) Transcript_156057:601-936(+)
MHCQKTSSAFLVASDSSTIPSAELVGAAAYMLTAEAGKRNGGTDGGLELALCVGEGGQGEFEGGSCMATGGIGESDQGLDPTGVAQLPVNRCTIGDATRCAGIGDVGYSAG